MQKQKRLIAKLQTVAAGVILVASWLLPLSSAQATIMDLDALVAGNGLLMHQYTFEGASVAIREEDKNGSLHLDPVTYGTATGANILYQTGFDPTSMAVVTYRSGGDISTDFGGSSGAGLSSTANIAFPGSFPNATFEMLVRPDQASVDGSQGGVGFVAMTREDGGVRGYFMFQGSPSGSGVDDLSSLAGSAYATTSNQTAVSGLDPGSWYYVASTFDAGGDNADTLITTYMANLSLGETTLTNMGSTLVPGIFSSGGGGVAPLAVGIGNNANTTGSILSAFPGGIDSLAIYEDLLSESTLQSHLDALWLNNQPVPFVIPEPSTGMLLLGGLLALRRSRRKRAV